MEISMDYDEDQSQSLKARLVCAILQLPPHTPSIPSTTQEHHNHNNNELQTYVHIYQTSAHISTLHSLFTTPSIPSLFPNPSNPSYLSYPNTQTPTHLQRQLQQLVQHNANLDAHLAEQEYQYHAYRNQYMKCLQIQQVLGATMGFDKVDASENDPSHMDRKKEKEKEVEYLISKARQYTNDITARRSQLQRQLELEFQIQDQVQIPIPIQDATMIMDKILDTSTEAMRLKAELREVQEVLEQVYHGLDSDMEVARQMVEARRKELKEWDQVVKEQWGKMGMSG